MTEEEIKLNYITPSILKTWDMSQIRMEKYFTKGRIQIDGKKASRKEGKKADYILYYEHNLPLAIVEAKDNKHTLLGGMRQAIEYADILKVPFAYSSNGDGFVERNMLTGEERTISLEEFPSREELWNRYKKDNNITNEQENMALIPYYSTNDGKSPRYYQAIAVNRTLDAIAKGQNRILLVLATGTGKTYVAFQIMWRLLQAKKVRKILFLADRNILVDQSRDNDFKPLDKVMTKIVGHDTDTSYQVYLSLYHQLSDARGDYYKDFDPDFFDLIIIDECHRSSASEDSIWHDILTYFNSAVHVGLTATPKETEEVSNINYFGEPIYTYSLKEGIKDGFLAPYKVIRVNLDIDVNGWRPHPGMVDLRGNLIEDRLYEQKDFDSRNGIVVEERTKAVAKRVSDYLREIDPYAKTIIFCVDIPHAERMCQALRMENLELCIEDIRYVTQITGDNPLGKAQLDNFIGPYEKYPVIAVTSKLMSTGVDAKTCKVVVLDKPVGSMTEFKQIIGRGTRVYEECDKLFFTILDFRKNYTKFSDPEFDGDPVMIYDVNEEEEFPNDEGYPDNGGDEEEDGENGEGEIRERTPQYIVKGNSVNIINEKVEYLDANGKLITMDIIEYSRMNLRKVYHGLEEFRNAWLMEKCKHDLLNQLEEDGVFVDIVKEIIDKSNVDEFDIVSYIGYNAEPLTKDERIDRIIMSGYLDKFNEENKEIVRLLLDEYREKDIDELRNLKILKLPKFIQKGSPKNILNGFGGKDKYNEMLNEVESEIYTA